MELTGVCPLHFKSKSIELNGFAAMWKTAKMVGNIAADGLDLLIKEFGLK
jgi:hypothetical protein